MYEQGGGVDEYHGILHGVERRAEIVQHRFLTLAQCMGRYEVVAAGGREHQAPLVAGYPVARKQSFPMALDGVELCALEFYLASVPGGIGLHLQQAFKFVGEEHVDNLVKLADSVGAHIALLTNRFPVQPVDRPRHGRFLSLRVESRKGVEHICPVAAEVHHLLHEA